MNKIYFAGVLALLSGVAACSEQPNANREATGAPAEQSTTVRTDAVYSATGAVTAVAGETVTISHGPVPDLQWPAMTMEFRAFSSELIVGLAAGTPGCVAFPQAGGGSVLA